MGLPPRGQRITLRRDCFCRLCCATSAICRGKRRCLRLLGGGGCVSLGHFPLRQPNRSKPVACGREPVSVVDPGTTRKPLKQLNTLPKKQTPDPPFPPVLLAPRPTACGGLSPNRVK